MMVTAHWSCTPGEEHRWISRNKSYYMSETNILDNKAPINPFVPSGLFCLSLWTDSFSVEGVSGLFLHYQLSQLRPFFYGAA